MRCPEARKLLTAHLDSELDARTSLEVEEHLKACEECAGLFAAERNFDQRLAGALKAGARTERLWENIEAAFGDKGRRGRRLHRRLLQRAALFALLASLGAWWWFKSRPLDLAAAVEECHHAYVQKFTSPEFTGAVPEEIARKLDRRLDLAAFSYHPASAGFDEQGARFCHVANVPVAVILGHFQRTPVSLFVLQRSELAQFPRTRRRLESGHPIVCGGAGRYQFAARLVDGHVVCVMGEAPLPQLEELLKTVRRT